MEEFSSWLSQTWIFVAAVVSGVTLIWKFKSVLKEMNDEIKKPIIEINDKLSKLEDSNKLTTTALLTLQRKSLLDSCTYYLSKGFASMEEKATMNNQYESYHELGGDSFITEMVQRVNNLPFEKKRKKIKNDVVVDFE